MARPNDEIAALLQEYAELFAMNGGDAFRVRSYQKAAKSIAGFPADISTVDVRVVPGVGEAIALKVEEFLDRGSFRQLDDLRSRVPEGVRKLTRIANLGPKTAMQLFNDLGIDSPESLGEAIKAGHLAGMRGFGPKTEENLLRGIAELASAGTRVHIGVAMDLADRILASLSGAAERIDYAGSLRRMKDTIGDIDILAVGPPTLMDEFARQRYVTRVVAQGPSKTSILTSHGLQVDLRVVPAESWGAAMQYFTGSKDHNVRLREMAVRRGWKLSEYGLFEEERVIASESEEEIYQALGLPWIAPTLREDGGEIQAALQGELPDLVTSVIGDLHTHTDLTDGVASLEDMVAAAAARGYAYYAVTDHAPDLFMQRMTLEKALAQREQLERLQAKYPDMRLLHGTELNIAPSGTVDWPGEVLAGFDVCVASVHSHFGQSREEMTRRFITACENPYVDIIGHPTTRKIGKRQQVDADWDEIFKTCARTGTAMEIDAYPDRLDLPSDLIRRALHHGVKFSIDSDSHAVPHLANIRYGIGAAQRGWLTPDDVINTWPLERLQAFLRPS